MPLKGSSCRHTRSPCPSARLGQTGSRGSHPSSSCRVQERITRINTSTSGWQQNKCFQRQRWDVPTCPQVWELGSRHSQTEPGTGASQVPPVGDRRHRFDPWVGKTPLEEDKATTQVLVPGESHGQRSLAGYSPRGRIESDTTEATERTHGPIKDNINLKTWFQTGHIFLLYSHFRDVTTGYIKEHSFVWSLSNTKINYESSKESLWKPENTGTPLVVQ